jgi:ADP-ribose pyrophosphatase YjhB (NUDIX family)
MTSLWIIARASLTYSVVEKFRGEAMGSPKIKVKSMGIFVSDGRMLVMTCFDSIKQKAFFRLLGGHVEFGEDSRTTLRREMQEELAAEVDVSDLLDVIQNVFTFEGRPHHEVIFVHRARFLDDSYNRREDLRNIEADKDEPFIWVPIEETLKGPVPLYPTTDYARLLAMIGAGNR